MAENDVSPWLPGRDAADVQFVQHARLTPTRRRRVHRRSVLLAIVGGLLLAGSCAAIVLLALGATGTS